MRYTHTCIERSHNQNKTARRADGRSRVIAYYLLRCAVKLYEAEQLQRKLFLHGYLVFFRMDPWINFDQEWRKS